MSVQAFLTIAQAAERLGVTPGKVLGWIGSGELAAIDVSAARNQRPRWRIDPTEFERFLNARRSAAAPKPARNRKPPKSVTKYIQ